MPFNPAKLTEALVTRRGQVCITYDGKEYISERDEISEYSQLNNNNNIKNKIVNAFCPDYLHHVNIQISDKDVKTVTVHKTDHTKIDEFNDLIQKSLKQEDGRITFSIHGNKFSTIQSFPIPGTAVYAPDILQKIGKLKILPEKHTDLIKISGYCFYLISYPDRLENW